MSNDEFFNRVSPHLDELRKSNMNTKALSVSVIGENLLVEDLLICSMLNRNIHLTNGLISMIETRNLTCAGALLRLQMDNCLRLFALFIANDKYDHGFASVYDQSSGFIHFSSKAFYQSVQTKEPNVISVQVSDEPPEMINTVLLECTNAYLHYIKLVHTLINIVADSKAEFDENYQEYGN